jgi:hypothetical protein
VFPRAVDIPEGAGEHIRALAAQPKQEGAMGRITRSLAGRRALIGLIGLGALALAACVPVGSKPAPVPDEPAAPPIEVCVPVAEPVPPDTNAAATEVVAAQEVCLPICLPGQEPPPVARVASADCVPLCPIAGDPKATVLEPERPRCLPIPIPCLPGRNPPSEVIEIAVLNCVPLCQLAEVFPGIQGLEPCRAER